MDAGPYVGFYFGGGLKIRGGQGPKPEAWKPESGGGVLGEGQPASSPSARESGERCKLPQRGPGQSPGRLSGLLHFVDAKWLSHGISKASGQTPEATYYGACNFYTAKKISCYNFGGKGLNP